MSSRVSPVAVIFALLAGCTGSVDEYAGQSEEIAFGVEDTTNQFPNVGAMAFSAFVPNDVKPRCSGTLIAPRAFLTAAHCADFFNDEHAAGNADNVWVTFAQNPATAGAGQYLLVSSVVVDPEYPADHNVQQVGDPHDVAVLVLARNASPTPAATAPLGLLDALLAAGALKSGSFHAPFTVVGYGVTDVTQRFTQNRVRRIGVSEFKSLTGVYLNLDQNPAHDNGGTCFGDSGGPTFWIDAAGNRTVVSITSRGDANCQAFGASQRIDIADSVSFIGSVLATL